MCIRLKCSVKRSACEVTIFATKRDERKFSKNIQWRNHLSENYWWLQQLIQTLKTLSYYIRQRYVSPLRISIWNITILIWNLPNNSIPTSSEKIYGRIIWMISVSHFSSFCFWNRASKHELIVNTETIQLNEKRFS